MTTTTMMMVTRAAGIFDSAVSALVLGGLSGIVLVIVSGAVVGWIFEFFFQLLE